MLASRECLSAYLKNGVAYRIGRRALTSETRPHFISTGRNTDDKKYFGVIFVYRDSKGNLELSPEGQRTDKRINGKLTSCLKKLKTPDFKLGDTLLIPDVIDSGVQYLAMVLTCIGPKDAKVNPAEGLDEKKAVTAKLLSEGVSVTGHTKEEIEMMNMHAFLAVAQGSSAAPVLLECDYVGKSGKPYVLMVAKGVTFDSGGLCLKKREDMLMHSGMTGAAAALGTLSALATLKVPVNVKLLVPLCENMISGECLKVGDVVPTLKGDKVKVEDTDLEGHLMLADVLTYGQKTTPEYTPKYVMSIASLTPGITEAVGGGCYGCFTKDESLWKIAYDAGVQSGDRPWRFPIWKYYSMEITGNTPVFNWKNRGSGIASHCAGASFLDKFVTSANWLHYDITGVGKMVPGEAPTYLDPKLMTGRPTRALIHTIMDLAKKM